jgi:hypothetical protein
MNIFYSIYQPKAALDRTLWSDVKSKLSCDFAFNSKITNITQVADMYCVTDDKGSRYIGRRIFLAIPPTALGKILPQYEEFAGATAYLPYIQMTLSWKASFVSTEWGNVIGPWGLIWIPLSDYFIPNEGYQTVLSVSISKQYVVGLKGYKACMATKDQLIQEVLAELLAELHCELPDHVLLNPMLFHDGTMWNTNDVAYVKKPNMPILPSKIADNLYTIGWHNDNGTLAFATLENAVVSAKVLANELSIKKSIIEKPVTLRFVIILLMMITTLIIGIIMIISRTILKSGPVLFRP